MNWPLKFRHEVRQNRPIELAQYQPFGTAGCTSNRTDRRYVESVISNGSKRTRACFECQRDRFHRFPIKERRGRPRAAIIRTSAEIRPHK